jgi:hypothetical protein
LAWVSIQQHGLNISFTGDSKRYRCVVFNGFEEQGMGWNPEVLLQEKPANVESRTFGFLFSAFWTFARGQFLFLKPHPLSRGLRGVSRKLAPA